MQNKSVSESQHEPGDQKTVERVQHHAIGHGILGSTAGVERRQH